MSFSPQSESETPLSVTRASELSAAAPQEVFEELIVPTDRQEARPDTHTDSLQTESELGDVGLDYQSDGRSDLDWAEMELKMVNDGADGSMTPLTEASWMDESLTPTSSCPGTPDGQFDLYPMQPLTLDRVSASGHVRHPGHTHTHTLLVGLPAHCLLPTTACRPLPSNCSLPSGWCDVMQFDLGIWLHGLGVREVVTLDAICRVTRRCSEAV